jgi:LPS sulfotransferase NodH
MQYIVKLDALWADFFQKHHIQPLVYVYEDFVLDPKIYLKELINYVGIAMPEQFVVESEHRVVSDKNNEDWYQQYLAHLETEESQRRKQRDFFLQFRRLSQRIFYKFKSLQKR